MSEDHAPQRDLPARPSPVQWILLALIMLAALGLRLIYLPDTEANFDELWHLELSTGRGSMHLELPRDQLIERGPAVTSLQDATSWTRVPGSLDTVTHPPVYPVLLRFWRMIFGESIPTARAFSALAAALCVWPLFELVRLLHRPSTALWACAILAVSSAQIDMAQEVRNYALATLWCLCAAAALVRVQRFGADPLRLAGLGISCALALFTHYFTAPVLAALGLYALITMRRSERTYSVAATCAAALVFALLWGPMVRRQASAFEGASAPGALGDVGAEAESHNVQTLKRLAAIPVRLLFEPRKGMETLPLMGVVLFALPWLLIARNRPMLLWAMWLTFVVGLAAGLDFTRGTRHLEQLRHAVLAGPAVAAFLAAALAVPGMRPVLAHGLPAIVVLACVMAIGLTYTRSNPHYSDIGAALARGGPTTFAEPVVFCSDPDMRWWADVMYLGAAHYSSTFPRPMVRVTGPVSEVLRRELRRRWSHVWVVRGATGLAAEDIVPGTVAESFFAEPHLGSVSRLRWDDQPAASQP